MRPGQLIKHERYMDIYLKLTHVFDYGHGIEIKAQIWNMGFVESYPIGQTMRLNIAKTEADLKEKSGRNTHLGEWLTCRPLVTSNCQRYAGWRKIK